MIVLSMNVRVLHRRFRDRLYTSLRIITHTSILANMPKVSSNGKSSLDLVVVVRTKSDPRALMHELAAFVLSRLPRDHPGVYRYSGEGWRDYHYHVVCGTSSIKSFASVYDTQEIAVTHKVYVAIHLDTSHTPPAICSFSDEGVVVDGTYDVNDGIVPLSADTVAKCLSIHQCGKPWLTRILRKRWSVSNDVMDQIVHYLESDLVRMNVLDVGVSAVDSQYMAKLWREITQPGFAVGSTYMTSNITFNHRGLGPGRHPMMILDWLCESNDKFEHPLFFVNSEGERVDGPRTTTMAKDHESEDIGSTSEEEESEDDQFDATDMCRFAWIPIADKSHSFHGKEWQTPKV
jgi:hypothetical protein